MTKKEFLGVFEEDLFYPGLEAESKAAGLTLLVDALFTRKRVYNRQAVLTTIVEREKLCTTALGKGLAIPHSRSTMVDRLTVLFGGFPEGLPFDADDDKPVTLVFLILAPPQDVGNEYLPFIGKLVEVVKEKKNRDALKKVSSFKQFVDVMEKAL
jgi:mannitol/fructose-specific phosphotransferase system IIA component (Ntr-type)